ncbi:hypothetical protein AVEN_31654-1 [Araneus ventricosus]|uniref:Uncharacterized protein n=1 Tax=Araneus ventricosus TaxID=182803 RepID=A0A4Y2X042_ARAVE|nr:hypothetical protein AVEN_31654-1 [Araneus ventricosus]
MASNNCTKKKVAPSKRTNDFSPNEVCFVRLTHGEKEFTQFFSKEGNLIFCNDVQELKKCFDIEYAPYQWRLYRDSSKTSLKAVLLHIGNSFASLPLGHSMHLEENYNYLSLILEKINYQEHRWMVCGDFKMLTMLLGQQAGYTKYRCFLSCGTVEPETYIGSKLTGHFEVS